MVGCAAGDEVCHVRLVGAVAGGTRACVRSSAAGLSAERGSVGLTSCSATTGHTAANGGSNVATAGDDSLAPTISTNTLALTWRHLANAATSNQRRRATPPRPRPLPSSLYRISLNSAGAVYSWHSRDNLDTHSVINKRRSYCVVDC